MDKEGINKKIQELVDNGSIDHELKILPEYFEEVYYGRKRFELRENDRNFKVNDTFVLREYKDGEYTGRYFCECISFILKGCKEYGLSDGYCIFGW